MNYLSEEGGEAPGGRHQAGAQEGGEGLPGPAAAAGSKKGN
jgi:hypothetical protein